MVKTMASNSEQYLEEIYKRQAEICSALSNPIRLRILDILSFKDEKTNSEMLEILKIPKSNLTQHLGILIKAGIIETRKEGLYHYTKLAFPQIKDACQMIRRILLEQIQQSEDNNKKIKSVLKKKT